MAELSLDDVRAHLHRVMASAGFLGSESLRRLLAFTVEKAVLDTKTDYSVN